jgi:hypothetical protein
MGQAASVIHPPPDRHESDVGVGEEEWESADTTVISAGPYRRVLACSPGCQDEESRGWAPNHRLGQVRAVGGFIDAEARYIIYATNR